VAPQALDLASIDVEPDHVRVAAPEGQRDGKADVPLADDGDAFLRKLGGGERGRRLHVVGGRVVDGRSG
jgi:hypothetical protein